MRTPRCQGPSLTLAAVSNTRRRAHRIVDAEALVQLLEAVAEVAPGSAALYASATLAHLSGDRLLLTVVVGDSQRHRQLDPCEQAALAAAIAEAFDQVIAVEVVAVEGESND